MGTGHPRAKISQPVPVPAETRTHLYGCGFPVLTGAGLKGPMGMKTHMGLGVQNASQMHTRRQLTLVHLLRGYCTYRGVLTTRMILIVVCSYQNKDLHCRPLTMTNKMNEKSTPRLCEGWDGCRRQMKEASGMMKGSGGKPVEYVESISLCFYL